MGTASKCSSADTARAGMDQYVETLNQQCAGMIESQNCFAEAAAGFNGGLSELETLGAMTLSDGGSLNSLLQGSISNAAKFKLPGVSADGTVDYDAGQNNDLGDSMIKWQVGYSDSGKTDKYGRKNIVAAYRSKIMQSDGSQQAQKTVYTNPKTTYKYTTDDETGEKVVTTTEGVQALRTSNKNASQSALRDLISEIDAAMSDTMTDPADLAILKRAAQAAAKASTASRSEGMNDCAESYDKSQIALQTAAKDQMGQTLIDMALSDEDKKAALEGLERGKSAITQAIRVEQEVEYKEQCILLSQIVPLARFHRNLTLTAAPFRARLPYRGNKGDIRVDNAPIIADGEAYGFINRLTQSGAYKELFNMDNASIAALQPLIRLYKVIDIKDESGKAKTIEHEIAFDSFASNEYGDISDIFQNKARRGFGVGIKSFNVTFDGQDLFAATRSIKATLKLQANNFDEFLKFRNVKSVASKPGDESKAPQYRYIDLALKTGGSDIEKYASHLNSLNFRLKAVFGWNPNAKTANVSRGALKESFVSVNLTPVTHNFDFDEMGRVTFTIEYFAYVEELLSNPVVSIFTDPTMFSKILSRRIAYQTLELEAACTTDAESSQKKKAERQKADAQKIEKEKSCLMNHLITQIFKEDKVYILKFTRGELKRVVKEGPHFNFDLDNIVAPTEDASELMFDDLKEMWKSFKKEDAKSNDSVDKNLTAEISQEEVQIPFMYVGDIIDIIMGQMTSFLTRTKEFLSATPNYEDIALNKSLMALEVQNLNKLIEQYGKFRLTLGPLELYDQKTQKYVNVSFADIPVSVAHFTEFLTSKLLQKDQAIYPLTQFLKDFFNSLIKNYLNKTTCKGIDTKQKTRLFESCITSYGVAKKAGGKIYYQDRLTQRILAVNNGPRLYVDNMPRGLQGSILNLSGRSDFSAPNEGYEQEFNHFIFYAGRVQPSSMMKGIRSRDENAGIFHYLLGKDSGIVKNIQLRKTESPGLKEVRFETEGFRELEQLREVYDVEVSSYANIKAMPGCYIFVDPRGFSPNLAEYGDSFDLTDLGIGGYYMIIRSHHEFAPGVANTTFDAVWVHSKDSMSSNKTVNQDAGGNDKVKAKCNTARKRLGIVEIQKTAKDLKGYEPPKDTVSEPPDGTEDAAS